MSRAQTRLHRERANAVEIEFWKIGHLRSLAVTCSRRSLAVTCGHFGGHLRSLASGGHLRSLAPCNHFGGRLWAEPSDCIYGLVFHVGESLGILSIGKFLIFSRPVLGKYPTFSRP